MIKQTVLGIIFSLCCANALANTANTQTCVDAACFSEFQTTVMDDMALQQSPKVAWWYGSNSSSRSNRGSDSSGSWFVSVPNQGPAHPNGTIVFYPGRSAFGAYDNNGDLVKSGRASGGMSYCDDIGRSCRTPVGTFKVYNKGTEDCISRTYPIGEGGAPMPWCMYFNGGYALHGSYYVPNFPASHGCIRVTPETAYWLHQNFVRVGTIVKVQPY